MGSYKNNLIVHAVPASQVGQVKVYPMTSHMNRRLSLGHMPFVFVKNKLLKCELDGIVADSWRAQAAGKLDFELARFTK